MRTKIKICGLRTAQDIDAANKLVGGGEVGLAMLGFNFCATSPRFIEPLAAAGLAGKCHPALARVALFANASDDEIEEVVAATSPHYIQLHGGETPARCAEIKAKFSPSIIKALPVSSAQDLAKTNAYNDCADMFLFDSGSNEFGASNFGGSGEKFNWDLLRGFNCSKQWMLAGGLTAANVGTAIAASGAEFVDVASGVERERGQKDASLMAEFVASVNFVNDNAAVRAA